MASGIARAQGVSSDLGVIVRHAPTLNGPGLIQGSLQQLLGESITLNGGFIMTGDLLMPGVPTLHLNGSPIFAGTIVGTGSTSPSGYSVTLNGGCSLHYLRTRTTPVTLPTVSAPPNPAGTRTVTITAAGQSIGDPATLKNLTLNGSVGQVAVPPGTYGNLTANGGSGLILGVAGATQPVVYKLQNLTLNGSTRIDIISPIILTIANNFAANGNVGTTNRSAWLQLQMAGCNLTLNGGCILYGSVLAPSGSVIINGNSGVIGSVQSDDLIINGNGFIKAAGTMTQSPVATAKTLSVAEDASLNVTLTGSDPEGASLIFTVLSQPAHGTLSGTAPNLIYQPATNFNGADSFTFKVNDGMVDSATATVSINVTPVNDLPVALAQNESTPEDTARNLTLKGTDVDNDSLTFQIVTPPAHGTLSGSSSNVVYLPATNFNGSDSFTFRANDGTANSAVATVAINVTPVNDAPAALAQNVSTPEDTVLNVTLTGTDVENDPLSFSIVNSPSHGTLSGTAPNLVYKPAANYFGSDTFTFKVNDGKVNSATATVSINVTPVNDLPVAQAQTVTTSEDTALNLVLKGTDVDNDTLSFVIVNPPSHGALSGTAPNLVYLPATNFSGSDSFTFKINDGTADSAAATVSITVTADNDAPVAQTRNMSTPEDTALNLTLAGTDAENDTLSFQIVTSPSHGTLSGTAPNLIYKPATNYFGPDAFTFKVNDGRANSAVATVSINVTPVNDPPVALAQNESTPEDTARNLTLKATDADDDTLSFQIVTSPSHGSLSGTAPNVVYQPAPDFNGLDSFTFKVNDGTADSAVATVSINVTPVNDAPVAQAQNLSTSEDTALNLTLTGADVDNDTLSFVIVNPPSHGALSGTAPNLVYQPATNYYGLDAFTFKVNDGKTNSTVMTVSISVTPVNDAPVAQAQNLSLPENTVLNVTLTGTDVENDPLSFQIVNPPSHGTLSGTAPDLIYQPQTDYYGPDALTFMVNDGTNASASATVAITVRPVGQVPVVNAGSDQLIVLPADATLNGSSAFHPFPGAVPAVQWTMVNGPGTVTFDNASNAVTAATFSQSGVFQLRLTASDSFLSSSDDVIVTVDAPPSVNAGSNQTNTFPAGVILQGTVADDGLPANGVLTVAWSKVSGPGTVVLADASATNTTASVSVSGIYVLRLTANDGVASASSDVTVVINQPLVVVQPNCDHSGVTVKGYTALQYQSNFLYDIVFALDTSSSTIRGTGFDLNSDGREDTVFEAEVEACRRLTRILSDTNHIRFGLVKFARYHTKNAPDGSESDGPVIPDETRLVQPVTSDVVAFQAALDTVAGEGAKGGTDIAAGIDLAVQALTNASPVGGDFKTSPVRHIILLTDGIPTLPVESGFIQERGDRRATLSAAQRAAIEGIAIHPVVLDPTNHIERKLTTMPAVQAITGVPGEIIRINANNVQQLADVLSGLTLPGIPQVKVLDHTSGTNWTVTVQPNGWFEALLPVTVGTNNWEFVFSSGNLSANQSVTHSVSFVVYPPSTVVDVGGLSASNSPASELTYLEGPTGKRVYDGGPELSLLTVLTNKAPAARVLPGVESFRTLGGTMTLEFIFKGAGYNSDVGYFLFDPSNPPKTAAEVMAGLGSTNIFLNSGIVPNNNLNVSGLVNTIQVPTGAAVGLFMIPNGTLADAQAGRGNAPLFTLSSLNPGQFAQAMTFYDPAGHQIICAFEDIDIMSNNSDLDYQDLIFTVKPIDPLPQITECLGL